jgi:flavodoxin
VLGYRYTDISQLNLGGKIMNKPILIAYFSRAGNNYVNGNIVDLAEGNTEVAAGKIEEMTGGELFRIMQKNKYSDDYSTCTEEAQRELRANARPELTENIGSIEGFDTIVLAYPNWWGTMPMPVWTFLESCDFSGKTILPLCTHEGSGMGSSERDIKRLCPDAILQKGLAVRGGAFKSAGKDIEAWLKKNGLL